METNKVTMHGKQLTLVGRKIKVGMSAPKFNLTNSKLETVTLDDYKGKIKILTSFISLDTPTCDLQVKEFNKDSTSLSENVVILGISKDLPFAQARFCSANNIKNISVLSDYKSSSFGINYGLLIKELNLLARATIIVDENNIIRYIQIVDEITSPPNYQDILKHLQKIINSPSMPNKEEAATECSACKKGTPILAPKQIITLLSQLNAWQAVEAQKIVKEFQFKDFVEAKYFLDLLSVIAEEQAHHPAFTLVYNKLTVAITTHIAHGLTDNDFILARMIDEISF